MVQATVDRIREGIAVIILHTAEPKTILIPSFLLPEGCREGDIITLTIERNAGATETGRKRLADTIERLRAE